MIDLWRIEPFYDFSPNPTAALRNRRDPAGSFTVPAQNGDIEFAKESFDGDFSDRSITGRIRSNVQGTRLIGSLDWSRITDSTAKTNYINRLYSLVDMGFHRYFQRAATDGGETASTTIDIKSVGGQPVISDLGNFYKGMVVGIDAGGEPPNPFIGTFVRCTAYNAATDTITVDTAVTVGDNVRVDFWVPPGIPGAFFINTLNEEDGGIACMVTGESPIGLNVENRVATQPATLDFKSRDLVREIPASWLK